MTDQWDDVSAKEYPDPWDFDAQGVLTGTLRWRDTSEVEGIGGTVRAATFYCVETDDGSQYGIWGTANLDRAMTNVRDGDVVRIEHLGKESLSKGRQMHRFAVARRRA